MAKVSFLFVWCVGETKNVPIQLSNVTPSLLLLGDFPNITSVQRREYQYTTEQGQWRWVCTRTPQGMDGTLTLIFANSKTTWDFVTKFSALLQLRKTWILTKFDRCSSKIGPNTPFWIFLHFWREIRILSTYHLIFLQKAGFHRGWQLVKIWCWYLQPLLRNSKLTNFIFFSVT